MEKHGLVYPPIGDFHLQGNAFDISRVTVGELMRQVITEWDDVQSFVNSTFGNGQACNLRWGGRFTRPDRVHFDQP
jgi:hypothetical protein